jgi:hypothetical protein
MDKVDINAYLQEARKNAQKFGFDGDIELSNRHDKKLKFTDNSTKKVIHFGAKDYNDRIIYTMLYGKEYAKNKAEQYRSRAWAVFNNSKFLSPSSLSWYVLW